MNLKHLISKFSILTFSLYLFSSCNDSSSDSASTGSVSASFTCESEATTTTVVAFTNTSKNAAYYQWDFGDDSYSFEENPEHQFTNEGSYTVLLTAIGNDGSSSSASAAITVSTGYQIYEGEGFDNVQIYDTWSSIKSIYGTDTAFTTVAYSTYYILYVDYVDEGLELIFPSYSTSISSNDEMYQAFLFSPYDGVTKDGLGIGSNIDDITTVYGDPEDSYKGSSYAYYFYDSQGIGFYTYYTGEIDVIAIFAADSKKSGSTLSIKDKMLPEHLIRKQ